MAHDTRYGIADVVRQEWYEAAVAPDFVARRLPVATSLDVVLGVRSFKAKNVAGLLPGETSECILITAHHGTHASPRKQ